MSEAFDNYTHACNRMKNAEQTADTAVAKLGRTIGPLLGTRQPGFPPAWKAYYFAGLGNEVPAALVRQSGPTAPRRPIDVSSLQADLAQLQTAMAEYATAEQDAFQAHQQIPAEERSYVGRPPWQPR